MAKIIGTGRALPERVIYNKEFEAFLETSEDWIVSRTGIERRHFAGATENTNDLALAAGQKALASAGVHPQELDIIIVATCTPAALIPSTAAMVQGRLGAVNASAFDINAACTGFIYAMEMAHALLEQGRKTHALIIGAEVLSKITDFTDRSTAVLFGDGAGAAVLRRGEGILSAVTGADGTKDRCLNSGPFPVKNFFTEAPAAHLPTIYMEGKEVYKFAVNILPQAVNTALEEAGLALEDLDMVVPHQANVRIIEAAAKRLGLPMDKFYVNLMHTGNTSAASIPIALDEMNEKGLLKEGMTIALVGFGGGLTYGAAVLRWSTR